MKIGDVCQVHKNVKVNRHYPTILLVFLLSHKCHRIRHLLHPMQAISQRSAKALLLRYAVVWNPEEGID